MNGRTRQTILKGILPLNVKLIVRYRKDRQSFSDKNLLKHNHGGRTWQPFVGGKNGLENFRHAHI